MEARFSFNCDFCGKPELTISLAGIVYCQNCKMSYGEQPFKELEAKCSEEKKEIIKSILKQNVPDVALQMAMQNAQIVRSPNIPMQDIPTTKSANAKNVE